MACDVFHCVATSAVISMVFFLFSGTAEYFPSEHCMNNLLLSKNACASLICKDAHILPNIQDMSSVMLLAV